MSTKHNAPDGESGAQNDQLAGGSDNTVPRVRRARPVLIATRGRIEFITRCPGCKHMHRHIHLGIVDAPCGASYNLGPRRGRVA
ncbi:hypothetical protein ABZ883_03245 [Streptomyces sp. NPDC046977]|uniref:hypothetical protein n=1 Tax=Streptomyces sp. NPDC046977 TaxID=3154703 RepID=UPI0033C086A4